MQQVSKVCSPALQQLWPMLRAPCWCLQGALHLKMYGLAYITAASPQPGSSFSADGEVSEKQGGRGCARVPPVWLG